MSVACIRRSWKSRQTVIHQLFGLLAQQKQQEATSAICTAPFWYSGYHFVRDLHTWVWLEIKDLHLEAWGPANSCAQAALVKRRWTQFCQGADTGKAISLWSSLLRGHEVSRLQHESTRPNTTRLLKTFGYVWHVSAHAIWSWCGWVLVSEL